VVLPADHLIPDAVAFERAIRRAVRAAAAAPVLVTLGIHPTRPETGYGYIAVGAGVPGHSGLHRVRRFVEKPDEARARRFVRGGRHLWNAGIFVWRARTFLDEMATHAPDVHAALARLTPRGRRQTPTKAEVAAAYRSAPSLPVDVALMERSRHVWTLPVRFRWSDVGTWASLADELGAKGHANRTLGGDAVIEDGQGNLVWSAGRQIVLVGVEGLAVIDAGDALLVARLDRSQQLRRAVETLRSQGREDLL
jgi:mannose-1-phosphate guanylyltransferase